MVKLGVRVFKRENGVWFAEIKRGVKRSLKTKDEREAKIRANMLEREILKGKVIAMDGGSNMTLQELIDEYLRYAEQHHARTTMRRLPYLLGCFVKYAGAGRRIDSLRARDLEGFIEHAKKLGLAATSINLMMSQVKAMLAKAIVWKHIKEHPFKHVKLLRVHVRPPTFLLPDEIPQIISKITTKRTLLNFALHVYTGARTGEIAALNWEHINQKADFILFEKTKTYKSRKVPITPSLSEILDKYPAAIGRVFDTSANALGVDIKRLLIMAGYGHLRPRDLRHTFASNLTMSGVDLYTTGKLLGHASVTTTMIYAHLNQDALVKAMGKLPY